MPNPWVSLRRDQLIPVNKAVNKKEQLDKRAGGGGGKIKCERILLPYILVGVFAKNFFIENEENLKKKLGQTLPAG
jgi:hypothetical protein